MKHRQVRLCYHTEGKAVLEIWIERQIMDPGRDTQSSSNWGRDLRNPNRTNIGTVNRLPLMKEKVWERVPQHCCSTQSFTLRKSLILPSSSHEQPDAELPNRHSKEARLSVVGSNCLMFVKPELCWKDTWWVMGFSCSLHTGKAAQPLQAAVYCTALCMRWVCKQIH